MSKKLPKIVFVRSWVYDMNISKGYSSKGKKFPPEKKILKSTRDLEKLWKKHEHKILTELSKVLNLPWNELQINVYITAEAGWFSSPLTISVIEDGKLRSTEWLFHTLTHELIHRIWSEPQNWQGIYPAWAKMMKKYKKEENRTQSHIPVHAVHKHIFLTLFSAKELREEIKDMQKYPPYARSWEIVERDGYQNIIKSLNPKYKV